MGKPTGFLEYPREAPADRPAAERIGDWEEYQLPMPEESLRRQGSRCIDCGIPFCHTGMLIGAAASGCPIRNLVPEWNDLVYRGLWREALERLLDTNNFPEFTGRVCPAPCEGSCVLGLHAPAVTIKNLERAIIDRGFEEGWVKPAAPGRRTGKRVAVVGSGPAGLACAAQLNRAGHRVTVYERQDRVGGLLMYGIPNMKLAKTLVQRRVDMMAAEGISFVTNTEIGRDVPAGRIRSESDAVVLCCGATRPRDLPVEGRHLRGIHFAVPFLRESTRLLLDSADPARGSLSARNRSVVVLGGGDTGTDCVGTSLRQGCRDLRQFEILPRPPEARRPDNPWPEWPRVARTDYGQEEAIVRFGGDPREYGILTKEFLGDPEGNVRGVRTVRVDWGRDANGRYSPTEIPGTKQDRPADMVLIAMGFLGPDPEILDELGIERDERDHARAPHGRFATNVEGVFAAGDMRRGQSLVVWAIEEGRGAARECDRYLMGSTRLP
jgi:glutamate synthase (NADPH/NADH) small chain